MESQEGEAMMMDAKHIGHQAEMQCAMALRRGCSWYREWERTGSDYAMNKCTYEQGRADARVSTLYDCNHSRSYEWLLRLERLKGATALWECLSREMGWGKRYGGSDD